MLQDMKYAVVTGAASGMGRCYALQLAERGYGVVLVDINGLAAEELALRITRQHGVPAPVICMDLTLPDAAERIVSQCRTSGWRVEVLVNNAGMLITSTIENAEPEQLRRIMALHCTTPLLLCRLLLPLMKEQGGGYILNISSITAWMDWPLVGMYGCTKRFVKGYSRALRIECMGTPVSVTTAVFGAVDTPMSADMPFMRHRKLLLRMGIMLSPERATQLALKAMFRRRATLIPCFTDRLVILLCPLLPNRLLHLLVKRFAHLFEPARATELSR